MICHEKKFIFLHIPKCAGNSLKDALPISNNLHSHSPLSTYSDNLKHDYYKFTFIRNPWDRFVSAYFYLITGGMKTPQDLRAQNQIAKYKSFNDFIFNCNFDDIWHFKPISFFLDDKIDYVGRVETIQSDFNLICKRIGIPHIILKQNNSTTHNPYWEYYDDSAYKFIAEKYQNDIETYNYKFGE